MVANRRRWSDEPDEPDGPPRDTAVREAAADAEVFRSLAVAVRQGHWQLAATYHYRLSERGWYAVCQSKPRPGCPSYHEEE